VRQRNGEPRARARTRASSGSEKRDLGRPPFVEMFVFSARLDSLVRPLRICNVHSPLPAGICILGSLAPSLPLRLSCCTAASREAQWRRVSASRSYICQLRQRLFSSTESATSIPLPSWQTNSSWEIDVIDTCDTPRSKSGIDPVGFRSKRIVDIARLICLINIYGRDDRSCK